MCVLYGEKGGGAQKQKHSGLTVSMAMEAGSSPLKRGDWEKMKNRGVG